MIVDDLDRRFGFDIVPIITDTKRILKNLSTLMDDPWGLEEGEERNGRFKKVRAESAPPAPLELTMEHLHLQVKLGSIMLLGCFCLESNSFISQTWTLYETS